MTVVHSLLYNLILLASPTRFLLITGGETGAQGTCSDGWQSASLGGCEIGVPHVDDEHQPRAGAIVPHLVLETIVEHQCLSHLPLSVNKILSLE